MFNLQSICFCLVAIVIWVLPCTEARASQEFSCAIIGSKKNSIKLVDDGIRNPPLHLVNCSGVQLLEDNLTVCTVGNANEKKCQNFLKNSILSAELVKASGKLKLSDTVIAMLRGDVRTAAAQTRSSSPYPGLPYGEVVGVSGEISYDFPDDQNKKVTSLKVYKPGGQHKVIAEILKVNSFGSIKLDASDSSVAYAWEINTVAGEKIKGTFTYLGEMAEVIDQRVNAIDSQIEIGESARWYLKADLYSEYGLQFDFEIALGKLKRRLFQEAADEEE